MGEILKFAFLAVAVATCAFSRRWSLAVLGFCLPFTQWLPQIPIPTVNALNLLLLPVLIRALAAGGNTEDAAASRTRRPILVPAALFFSSVAFSWITVQFGGNTPPEFLASGGLGQNLITLKEFGVAFLLYFCGRRLTADPEDRRRALLGLMAGFMIEALTASREFLLGDAYRATAHLGHPNKLGHFLAAYMMIPLAFALVEKGRTARWALAALVATGLGLLGSVSRGAILAAGGALAVVVLIRRSPWMVVIALMLGTAPYWLPEKVMARFDTLTSDEPGGVTLEELEEKEGRIRLWEAGIRMMTDNPLGVGMEQFRYRLLDYGFTGRKLKTSHNLYLQLATEQGWIAPLSHLWMMLALIGCAMGLAVRRGAPFETALGLGFVGVAVSFLLSTNFGDGFYENNLSGTFWVLAGLVVTTSETPALPAASAAEAEGARS